MTDAVQQQLIAELAREQVAHLAPDELPLFRSTCEAYFKDPDKVLADQQAREDLLGFGASTVLAFVTPVVLAIMTEVVLFLAEEVRKSVKEESSAVISGLVKSLFKRFRSGDNDGAPAAPRLTPDQLARIRRIALEKAQQLNLPESQAGLLADSLVGSLAITT